MSNHLSNTRRTANAAALRRSAPFDEEPGYYEPAGLWLYGNPRLLTASLAHVPAALGASTHSTWALEEIEREAKRLVLDGNVLVAGIHNAAHQRAAAIPLKWGAPRILVLSGGIRFHLGTDLKHEPFRVARLWRSHFDPRTNLVVSRRWPDRLPTFAVHNPCVDRLVERITRREVDALLFQVT